MHEVELKGLDGGNLLGFLAALGTFRALTLADRNAVVRVKWASGNTYTPLICHERLGTRDELLEALDCRVCGEKSINQAWTIGNDLTLTLERFSECLEEHSESEPETLAFLAAFGSEAVGSGPKKEQMSDTEFRTMSGAGHQHFLGFMRELASITGLDHLRRSLFQEWDYADGRPSLRWDPADYRPHALRAEDPSGDPIKTMRGANRLAIEALPLFPTVPVGRRVRTVGFYANRDGVSEITWPIWSEPLDIATVRSLLASDEIQNPNRSAMAKRNVVQVFRARRFTEGKYRNFSPARALL